MKDIGVEMTFAGGANDGESNGVLVSKAGDNLLSIASKTDPRSNAANEGYKILLEQAVYEMNRGSHAVALEYLNRAVQVQHQFNLKISNTVDGKIFVYTLPSFDITLTFYTYSILQMNPKDPDTLIQRGACLVEVQRFEPAIKDMEKVFELLELREGILDCSHLKSR